MPPKKKTDRPVSGRKTSVACPTEAEEKTRKKVLEETFDNYVDTVHKPHAGQTERQKASRLWFIEHAGSLYPNIGTRPLAVPPYFTGSYQPPLLWEGISDMMALLEQARDDEKKMTKNIIKGDNSQRFVGRAFRMLMAALIEEKGTAMVVISQPHNDNVLGLLRRGRQTPVGIVPKDVDETLTDRRGETDLIVLDKEKGVVFVEIKAVGDKQQVVGDEPDSNPVYEPSDKDLKSPLEKARVQLEKDVGIFHAVMSFELTNRPKICQPSKVIAVPYMSAEVVKRLTSKDDNYKDIAFLCEDHMFTDNVAVPESKTDLEAFRAWWEKLPQKSDVDIATMKDIVGRYVGLLSTAVTFKQGSEMTFYRSAEMSLYHTSCLNRRVVLSPAQVRILEELEREGEGGRSYLSGPPGSGKTPLMTLRCRRFLVEKREKNDDPRHAVIVNMFRGAPGRAIGHHIMKEVTTGDLFEGRVHLLNVDVGDLTQKQFTTEVNKCFKGQDSKLMFVIDEVYAECFWSKVLKALEEDFPLSRVVCAGLFSAKPTGFTERRLDLVHRCPPAVQNLLYQVDWDETRKQAYVRDCGYHRALSTNGPPPLCVRHELHRGGPPGVMDCPRCGAELADVLLPLVGKSAGGDQACAATAAEPYDVPADMKVAILVNMPRACYHETRHANYVETTESDYHGYMKDVSRCPLVSTLVTKLKARGLDVHLELDLAPTDLHEDALPSPFLTWLYNFQGLEAAVVVYLPGDPSPGEGNGGTVGGAGDLASRSSQEEETPREIPAPGVRKHPASSPEAEVPTDGKAEGGAIAEAGAGAGAGAGDGDGDGDGGGARQWTRADVQRYSRWDQTNILVAGSGCLCQLVLVVP